MRYSLLLRIMNDVYGPWWKDENKEIGQLQSVNLTIIHESAV